MSAKHVEKLKKEKDNLRYSFVSRTSWFLQKQEENEMFIGTFLNENFDSCQNDNEFINCES